MPYRRQTAVYPTLHIRPAESADSGEICRLCIELGYTVTPAEIAARLHLLQDNENKYVAVAPSADAKLLGWVAAEHRLLLESGDRVEIVGLVVDRFSRRKGIGKGLVAAAESWASARGVPKIFVRSNVSREAAHIFYEQIGYERAKTQHAYIKNVPASC